MLQQHTDFLAAIITQRQQPFFISKRASFSYKITD
jgi:hypothetical protein